MEGTYVLQTEFNGGLYDLDMVIDNSNTVTGGYPTLAPFLNFVNSGVTVADNDVVITYHYVELPGYEAILTGTIALDGTMSGTWVDNGGPGGTERTGTWQTISGNALLTDVNCLPECNSATPSVTTLWSPNHKMVPIAINGVTDPDGNPITITVNGVKQDEPTNGLGDGDKSPDAIKSSLQVRSERSGLGDGRVYEITFTADDGQGGSCSGTVQVTVPHDMAHPNAQGTPTIDSTLP